MSGFNEIDFVKGLKKSVKKTCWVPTFLKKVLNHYDLWLFSRDTLRTLKHLFRDYNLYITLKEQRLHPSFDIEEIRNSIEKMSPEKIFYSEVFGLADFHKHESFSILYWAAKFLLYFRDDYLRGIRKKREFDLVSKDIKDLKNSFFFYEKNVPSPFDSLTDEDLKEIRKFAINHYI